jgi:predicted DNA-binding transcriptional regulator AlpA
MTSSATTSDNSTTDRYLSEPDLRTYLGYSPSTIRRFRKQGMPCIGQDRLRRYHLGSVLKWLNEHR